MANNRGGDGDGDDRGGGDGVAVNFLYDITSGLYVARMPASGMRVGMVSVFM